MNTMNGIDISKWQADLDLSKIKCDFVIMKATEGIGYVDHMCDSFFQQALALKKCIGFYHYARPVNDPVAEAQFFVENTKNYFGCAIPVLDWEAEDAWNVTWAKQWLDEVQRLTGVKPIIYMSESVVTSNDWSPVVSADYGLWVAKYRDNDTDPNYDMSMQGDIPSSGQWPFYCMWQWTSSGVLDGYSSKLDCNVFYGDTVTWNKYAGSQAPEQTKSEQSAPASEDEVAQYIAEGSHGWEGVYGQNRWNKLIALGYDADAVQQKVNALMGSGEVYYTVQSGDTLSSIAEQYGTTWQDLQAMNGIENANLIYPGQSIRVK